MQDLEKINRDSRQLKKLFNAIKNYADQAHLSKENILKIFIDIRSIFALCEEKHKNKYPSLAFYCDLLLHPFLDRRSAKERMHRMLRSLNKYFQNNHLDSSRRYNILIFEARQAIGLRHCLKDLLFFLKESNTPMIFLKEENIKHFVRNLFCLLDNRRLECSNIFSETGYFSSVDWIELGMQTFLPSIGAVGVRPVDDLNCGDFSFTVGITANESKEECRVNFTKNQREVAHYIKKLLLKIYQRNDCCYCGSGKKLRNVARLFDLRRIALLVICLR